MKARKDQAPGGRGRPSTDGLRGGSACPPPFFLLGPRAPWSRGRGRGGGAALLPPGPRAPLVKVAGVGGSPPSSWAQSPLVQGADPSLLPGPLTLTVSLSPHPPSLRPSSSSPRILPEPHLGAPTSVPSAALSPQPGTCYLRPQPFPRSFPPSNGLYQPVTLAPTLCPADIAARSCPRLCLPCPGPVSWPAPHAPCAGACPTAARALGVHTLEAQGAKLLSGGRKTSCNVTSYPWLSSSECRPLTPFLAQGVHPARPP